MFWKIENPKKILEILNKSKQFWKIDCIFSDFTKFETFHCKCLNIHFDDQSDDQWLDTVLKSFMW